MVSLNEIILATQRRVLVSKLFPTCPCVAKLGSGFWGMSEFWELEMQKVFCFLCKFRIEFLQVAACQDEIAMALLAQFQSEEFEGKVTCISCVRFLCG